MQSRDSQPTPGRMIVKGAVVLGAAAILSKLLGTMQKIPLQNVAGDHVFGMYNAVYPLYTLILFLATAGFPVAVSRFVAEEQARGSRNGARRILKMSLVLSSWTGVSCFVLLYFGAGVLASWIGNAETAVALRSVSYALLVVPALAALRGYFQGLGDMVPTAVSQVAEQFARVAVMIALLIVFVRSSASDATIAAGATFGSVAGAVAGLTVMLGFWQAHRKKTPERAASFAQERGGERNGVSYRAFIAYALPICLGSVVLPILTLTDTFTVPRLLMQSGMDEIGAMTQFGLYNHGLPLVQLVSMIVSSMSVALIPAIAAAKAEGRLASAGGASAASIRLVWLIGLAASAGMAITAIPLNVMFYKSAEGYEAMMILAGTTVFSVVQIITGAILQGLGAERATAYHLLAAAAVKVALNVWLVPLWGIEGAAVAAVAAYATAAGLNMMRLRQFQFFRLSWRELTLKPLLCTAVMAAVTAAVAFGAERLLAWGLPGLPYRSAQTIIAGAAVAGGAMTFAFMLLRTRAITEQELAAVPKLGPKLLPLLRKTRFLPK